MNVDDGTSLVAKRVQTQSKRGMAQERKNGKHPTEKNRKFKGRSEFLRSVEGNKLGPMDVEENKDVVMNEDPTGKYKETNVKDKNSPGKIDNHQIRTRKETSENKK